MSDCKFYNLQQKDSRLESKFGVVDKLVITYFGAAGKANHLEYLVEAARYANGSNPQLHFLVVAHGSELKRIRQLSARYKLDNINFLSYRNRSELRKVLECDRCGLCFLRQ